MALESTGSVGVTAAAMTSATSTGTSGSASQVTSVVMPHISVITAACA
jgi:hypothetical protein